MLILLTNAKDEKPLVLRESLIDAVLENNNGMGSIVHLSNGKFHFVNETPKEIYNLVKTETGAFE